MVLGALKRTFPARMVHSITTEELEELMKTRGASKRSWNNWRCYVHAFFEFCSHDARRWVAKNPAKALRKHSIAQGLPTILTAEQVRELFAFLESYAGPLRCNCRPGYLVPYFALATFAGIRPSTRNGELFKLHAVPDKNRVIDEAIGVIRLTPEITKTNSLRQITIQPNLASWLKRYPVADWPLMADNMPDHVSPVRKRFNLSNDVLRHTFVSMHVAKFKSLGATAMEAGNSEAIIKRHYLNMVSPAEAESFWKIEPASPVKYHLTRGVDAPS
jgi:integrase